MFLLKIIVGIAVLYSIFTLGVFLYKLTRLPKLPHFDQSEKTLGTGPVLRYIAAGDSTGVGLGASTREKIYTHQIAEYLAKDHTVFYKNIAVTGHKTKDVLENQINQIIAFNPDIVTISMGANDATHLVSQKQILENYKAVIAKLEQETYAKIYITNIPNFIGADVLPWIYIQFVEYRSRSINQLIEKLGSERINIIDIHDFGWSVPPYSDRPKTYARDHFHPNDLGYQNWTNAFLDAIRNK